MAIRYQSKVKLIILAAAGLLSWIIFRVPADLFFDPRGFTESAALACGVTALFVLINLIVIFIMEKKKIYVDTITAIEFAPTNVVSAFAEEMLFRGTALYLMLPLGMGLAVVLSSTLFGLAHFNNPRGSMIITFIFGLFMALIVAVTHNLIGPMIAHFLLNVAGGDLFTQQERKNR